MTSIGRLCLHAVLLLTAAVVAADEPGAESFSAANTLLFATDHLGNVMQPRVLVYDFARSGPPGEAFADEVTLNVTAVPADGGRSVEIQFFSEDRARVVPSMDDVRGNPVVMLFLQRDVYEMGRETGGPWRHFQKRIKTALAESARVTSVSVAVGGEDVDASKITIAPYLTDPERARFPQFERKVYEFVIADDIPGGVYQIRSLVPPESSDAPMDDASKPVEEVLTYRP